jgi:hypothetical protein
LRVRGALLSVAVDECVNDLFEAKLQHDPGFLAPVPNHRPLWEAAYNIWNAAFES